MQQPASIYLNPGELTIHETPVIVTTVLGSCVAITLFNQRTGLGAICHAMLPHGGQEQNFRFVDHSLSYMLAHFYRKGVRPGELQVKLFGGAEMFEPATAVRHRPSVGRQNIDTCLALLINEGLMLRASCVGGNQGRKLLFYSHTGSVLTKKVPKNLPPALVKDRRPRQIGPRNLAAGI